MPTLQRNTRTGNLDAVFRKASGERITLPTGECLPERAWKRAAELEAETRFWEDHADGMWNRLAEAEFSPRYLHAVFVGRAHLIFPRFKALLREAEVKFKAAARWRDRERPKGRKGERRWLHDGQKRTIDDLLEFADPTVTRAALRFRLTESQWDVSRALQTPLMSRAESGKIGAEISNRPKG